MIFNVGFEILTDAVGQIKVDDEILEEIADREGISLDDMEAGDIWEMLVKEDNQYYHKARKDAYDNMDAGELGGIVYVEIEE